MQTPSDILHLEAAIPDGPLASERLLGVNLEMVHTTTEAIVSNRIRNPKFGGFANPQTGVAEAWQTRGGNWNGIAELAGGMFLSAPQCQVVQSYTGGDGAGILQCGIPIRTGEILEFRLWAKARHRPMPVEVSLRPASAAAPAYAVAVLQVDSAYWKSYPVRLEICKTDDEAVLMLILKAAGILHIDQVILEPEGAAGIDPDTRRAIAELTPPLLRFPGGCVSTCYHWPYGTGPRELRPTLPDPVFKLRTEYDFGTDEYLEQCLSFGIAPHITVNIGSGTPSEAAAWAAYCWNWFVSRGENPPAAYFQMGNEPGGLWETSHMTGDMYLEALQAFVPGVRAAYPGAQIIALGEEFSASLPDGERTSIRKTVLTQGRGLFDVLAIHCYKGQWFDEPEAQCRNAIESVGKVAQALDELADACREAGWQPRLALTEWNYWLHATHWGGNKFYEPDDAIHGIFFSGVIHTLLRKADVMELAAYTHLLVAMGLINRTGTRAHESAIGSMYRLYRSALPGRVLSLQWSSDPDLDSIALLHKEGTSVFLCNRSLTKFVPLEIAASFGAPTSCRTLAAPDCYSPMVEIECRPVGPTLPPLSLTRLDFQT